jgi:RNA polymerase sigma-70 factor (ECF subfamily)
LPPINALLTKGPVHPKEETGEAMSDNDLLEAVADGDRAAFALLMNRYLALMVTLAQRIVYDREQAREIAQEAFLRVWKNAAKWDPDGTATFATWLRRVVVNLAISCRRRFHEQVSLDVIDELPSDHADGFDLIATADQKRVVLIAMEKLPERQRAAIALYYYDDLPQVQAAEVLQMTPRAFDSLIVRARVNLKKYLTDLNFHRQEALS